MTTPSKRQNSKSSGRGLKSGVIIAIVVAILLIIAFVVTIVISNGQGGGLRSGSSFFQAVSTDENAAPQGYTITLDVSEHPGAVLAESEITVDYGNPVEFLPFATLEGMRFVGWFTGKEDDADATKVDNNSLELLAPDVSQTLYAHFEPRPTETDYDNPGLPILMYHYFYDPALGETGDDANWMDVNVFEEHLAYFRDNNYYYPTWEETVAYIRGEILLPTPSVVLNSDDGGESFFRLAVPLVEKYDAKMTSFIVLIDFIYDFQVADGEHIFIESHSYDMHRGGADGDARILTSSYQEVFDDAKMGLEILGDMHVYCYPFGKTNANAKQALDDAGVGVALVIENGRAYPLCDPMEVPRLRINDGATVEYLASTAY